MYLDPSFFRDHPNIDIVGFFCDGFDASEEEEVV